jgi:hypothetical protein
MTSEFDTAVCKNQLSAVSDLHLLMVILIHPLVPVCFMGSGLHFCYLCQVKGYSPVPSQFLHGSGGPEVSVCFRMRTLASSHT